MFASEKLDVSTLCDWVMVVFLGGVALWVLTKLLPLVWDWLLQVQH